MARTVKITVEDSGEASLLVDGFSYEGVEELLLSVASQLSSGVARVQPISPESTDARRN